ncbi:MAG: AhpC/TSA family protein [Prolixibacteraceae bacterium]|nr:AhpC/TSA family protein [Prolixibacteraceae bacterium]
MKNFCWILLALAALSACKKENFTIEGHITNAQSPMIYLDQLNINGTVAVDSSTIDENGKFKLNGSVGYPTFFLLRLNDQKFITLLIDSLDNIRFSADYLNFSKDYSIEGSVGSEQVRELNQHLTRTNARLDSVRSMLSMDNGTDPQWQEKWISEMEKIYLEQEHYSLQFINKNPFSLASVLAIYQKFNNGNYIVQDIQTIKVAASALHTMYPQSVHAQTLYKDTEKLVKEVRQQELARFVEQYGKNSPDITLPDFLGKNRTLSDLKGKVVLVQFWSAADKTCRVMNQVLRENYDKFKVKGFEIFQISIDTNKDAWIEAIEEDQLNWINVGDMNGSTEALTLFNVRSVPSNYLLNRDGTIAARNLKGPEIHQHLSEILN